MKNNEKYEHEISKLVNEGNQLLRAITIVAGISNGSNGTWKVMPEGMRARYA